MPAGIVVVHDGAEFAQALYRSFPDVAWFDDPMEALKFLQAARRVEFLITRLSFENRQSIGLSLARLTRAARPDMWVIFTGADRDRNSARGIGEFLEEPVTPRLAAMLVEWLRAPKGESCR
jgi:hypothetical protein